MQRTDPCFVCGRTETSIAYSQDPWCGDTCHKRLAFLLNFKQEDLNPIEFDAALRRLAGLIWRASTRKRDRQTDIKRLNLNDIAREIYRGRNGVEVYGSEDLLLEAERPGNWRDSGLRPTLEGWSL